MQQVDILRNMLNTAPPDVRKHLGDIKDRYGDIEVNKESPLYTWARDNKTAASVLKSAHKSVRELRSQMQDRRDSLQSAFDARNAQKNVVAIERCMRSIDVPYKSNANLYRIIVKVPGTEHAVSRGERYYRTTNQWDVEVPVSYHHNVKKVSANAIHQVTKDGDKWLNFITKYTPDTSPATGVKSFRCIAQAFSPERIRQKTVDGWYMEQEFDEHVYYAFAYTPKRAHSLLNKRVKAAMLEKLGVA